MGQAFRRASGRVRIPSDPPPKTVIDHRPPPPKPTAVKPTEISKAAENAALDTAVDRPIVNVDNILEDKDPKYDAMLGQMIGRITTKPGGKPEMGEAFLVQKSSRPMPRLRNTKPDSYSYEERPVTTGTLNIAQLRHIILLHEGKADDHNGPMNADQIAEKFKVDVVQIQRILQFLSQPPEDNSSKDKNKTAR